MESLAEVLAKGLVNMDLLNVERFPWWWHVNPKEFLHAIRATDRTQTLIWGRSPKLVTDG